MASEDSDSMIKIELPKHNNLNMDFLEDDSNESPETKIKKIHDSAVRDLSVHGTNKNYYKDNKDNNNNNNDNDDTEDENIPSSKQIQTHHPSGPWNYNIQLLLKKIGEKSLGHKWMHSQDQDYHENINDVYKIIEVVMQAVIATITCTEFIAFTSDVGLSTNKVAIIVITAIQLFLILLYNVVRGAREAGDHKENQLTHKYFSSRFNRLNIDIQEQFSLDLKDRITDKHFMRTCIRDYSDLLESNPSIREKTKLKYLNDTKNTDLYKPLIVGGFEQIEIVVDDMNSEHVGEVNPNKTNQKIKIKDKMATDKYTNKHKYEMDRWMRHF